MIDFFITYMPWLISAGVIFNNVHIGNRGRNAWLYAIALQSAWVLWSVLSHNWGFIPASIVMFFVNLRNHFKWTREAANADRS